MAGDAALVYAPLGPPEACHRLREPMLVLGQERAWREDRHPREVDQGQVFQGSQGAVGEVASIGEPHGQGRLPIGLAAELEPGIASAKGAHRQ